MKEPKKATKLHQPTRVRSARDAREPISSRARKTKTAPASKGKKVAVKKPAAKKAAKTPAKPVKKVSRKASKPKVAKVVKSPGRHSKYSPELGDRICELIADGVSWAQIEERGICSRRTLATWLRTIPPFHEHYSRAREARAEHYASKLDDAITKLEAAEDHIVINAQRTVCDQLRWMISSYYPRMYGQKLQVETTTASEQQMYDYSKLTDAELKTILALLDKAAVHHDGTQQ